MLAKRAFAFKSCLILFACMVFSCILIFVWLIPKSGVCEITLTNTTEQVVLDASIRVCGAEVRFETLAPYTATTHVFSITSDTGYQIRYTLDGFPPANTNVGYSTPGFDAVVVIGVQNDGSISYWHNVESHHRKAQKTRESPAAFR